MVIPNTFRRRRPAFFIYLGPEPGGKIAMGSSYNSTAHTLTALYASSSNGTVRGQYLGNRGKSPDLPMIRTQKFYFYPERVREWFVYFPIGPIGQENSRWTSQGK